MLTLSLCFRSELNLRRPIYAPTAKYGHFGNTDFPWEQPKELKL